MFFLWKKTGVFMLCGSLLLSAGFVPLNRRCSEAAVSTDRSDVLPANRLSSKTAVSKDRSDVLPANRLSSKAAVSTDWSDVLPANRLYSKACALMDGETGRLLYGKEQSVPRANASTTKILTCILALESGKTDTEAAVTKRAARQPRVRLGMKEGQKYKVEDLLYCLMLESFNDCAVAIAEAVSGSVEKFAVLMNKKAREIGCRNTYFITPNGLDDKDSESFHHTTAEDLCRIMSYCVKKSLKKKEFLKITGKKTYQFKDPQGERHSLSNHNRLLWELPGVVSGKTGFTADAGYCYVCAYEKDGRCFTAAFLGCGWPNNKNYKWKDARRLLDFGVKRYERKNIMKRPEMGALCVSGCFSGDGGLAEWGKPLRIQPYIDEERGAGEKDATGKAAEEKNEAGKATEEKDAAEKEAEGKNEVDKDTEDKDDAEKIAGEKDATGKAAEEKNEAGKATKEKDAAEKGTEEKGIDVVGLEMLVSDRDEVDGRLIWHKMNAPVARGQAIGRYDILLNGVLIKSLSVRSDRDIRGWTYGLLFQAFVRAFLL